MLSRKINIQLLVGLALTLGAVFLYWKSWKSPVPNRPQSVSLDAYWLGGADGGVWIKCTSGVVRGEAECLVFQDETGNLLVKGTFFSEKPLPQLVGSKDFYESLIYYDADGIHAKETIYRKMLSEPSANK